MHVTRSAYYPLFHFRFGDVPDKISEWKKAKEEKKIGARLFLSALVVSITDSGGER